MQQEDAGMRKAPQQARSQQRVDAILAAAAEMIGETGYEGITTSKLAKLAGRKRRHSVAQCVMMPI